MDVEDDVEDRKEGGGSFSSFPFFLAFLRASSLETWEEINF